MLLSIGYETRMKTPEEKQEALSLTHSNMKKGIMEIMGGQLLDYEAKRIAREKTIEDVVNMICFGVSEEKILSKYPRDIYDEALRRFGQGEDELKEM